MPACSFLFCRSRSGFCFPKDEDLRMKWVNALGREDGWIPGNNARLCAAHFAKDQFRVSKGPLGRQRGRLKLKEDAVPTVFNRSKPTRIKTARREPDESIPSEKEVELLLMSDPIYDKETLNYVKMSQPHDEANIATDVDHVQAKENQQPDAINCSKQNNLLEKVESVADEFKDDVQTARMRQILQENEQLRSELQKKKKELSRVKNTLSKLEFQLSKVFNQDQREALYLKKTKWTEATIMKALEVRFKAGTAAYELLLKQGLPYPCKRTLERKLQVRDFSSANLAKLERLTKGKISAPLENASVARPESNHTADTIQNFSHQGVPNELYEVIDENHISEAEIVMHEDGRVVDIHGTEIILDNSGTILFTDDASHKEIQQVQMSSSNI